MHSATTLPSIAKVGDLSISLKHSKFVNKHGTEVVLTDQEFKVVSTMTLLLFTGTDASIAALNAKIYGEHTYGSGLKVLMTRLRDKFQKVQSSVTILNSRQNGYYFADAQTSARLEVIAE